MLAAVELAVISGKTSPEALGLTREGYEQARRGAYVREARRLFKQANRRWFCLTECEDILNDTELNILPEEIGISADQLLQTRQQVYGAAAKRMFVSAIARGPWTDLFRSAKTVALRRLALMTHAKALLNRLGEGFAFIRRTDEEAEKLMAEWRTIADRDK